MIIVMIIGVLGLLIGFGILLDTIYSNRQDKIARKYGIISAEKHNYYRALNSYGYPPAILDIVLGITLLVLTPFFARDTYINNYLKGKYEVSKSVKYIEKDGVLIPKDSTYTVKPLPKNTKVVTIKVPATIPTQESEVDGVIS